MLDRLAPIREKDAVIATYNTESLLMSPEIIDATYTAHASTHISMGDTSVFAEKLIHWTRHNKGCVIGAIVGRYGFGKTSTAIHLWYECERNKVIAVPPFSWFNLMDIIDATYAWVNYRLSQLAPDYCFALRAIYDRYRSQSLETLAKEEKTTIDVLKGLLERGRLKLETKPSDVVKFLSETSALLAKVGREGPIVFTDELQVTLSDYSSREQFMDDLFGLLNELHQQQGSYGIVVSMPTATEALIADVRGDIIHRMQTFNFYLRPETLYGRTFATELWRKYAHIFDFVEAMSEILPLDTLKSIGQISSRQDLGAGPRTVVDAFQRAIAYYDESETAYMPTDLIDDYLVGEVAFDQNGKLGLVVREALGMAPVVGNTDNEFAIKLLAAFPDGCSEEIQHHYDIADIITQLPLAYRREFLYEFAEGPSLRKLAPTEVRPDPVFLRLTKEFIGRYKEDERHGHLALSAFKDLVMRNQVFVERRGGSLTGWKWESDHALVGSFSDSYPERKLYLDIALTGAKLDTTQMIEEFGVWIQFKLDGGNQDPGQVQKIGGSKKALLRLNGLRRPSSALNIAFLNDLGLPSTKLTPLFMLSLLQHLADNRSAIPNEEQARGMKTFTDQLLSHATKLLFNNELRELSEWSLTLIGVDMVKDIFNHMCEASYPTYETFITMRGWENALTHYINALSNARITVPIAHGNQPLSSLKDEIMHMFSQGSSQAFQNFQRSIPHLLEIINWTGREQGQIRLLLHPLEQAILDALDASTEKTRVHSTLVGMLGYEDMLNLFRRQGYLEIELTQALRLLNARRYLKLDERKRKFARLIESTEELQIVINEKLNAIRSILKLLGDSVGDFDDTKYSVQVAYLARKVESAASLPELEAAQLEVTRLRNEVNHQVERLNQINKSHIDKVLDTAERSLNDKLSLPEVGSELLWLRHTQTLQSVLESSLMAVTKVANELIENGNAILRNAEAAETPAAKLVVLYKGQVKVNSKRQHLEEQRQSAAYTYDQFNAWRTLLELAIRVEREADNCADTYSLPEFRDRFEALEQLIADEVAGDHKFAFVSRLRQELEKLEYTIQDHLAGLREQFIAAKKQREDILTQLSDNSIRLHASFDHYHPTKSHHNLELEVYEQLKQLIHDMNNKLTRIKGDVAYLSLVLNNPNLPDPTSIEDEERALRDSLEYSNSHVLKSWAERFQFVCTQIEHVQNQVAALLVKQTPTESEVEILDLLNTDNSMELGEVVRLLAQKRERQEFSLDQLVKDIEGLFQKNQIIINLKRR